MRRSGVVADVAALRAALPVGTERTIRVRVGSSSTRTDDLYVTVLDHMPTTVIVGLHPNMLAIPYTQFVEVLSATTPSKGDSQ